MAFETCRVLRGLAAVALACCSLLTAPAQAAAVLSQAWVSTWDLPGPFEGANLVGQASGGGSGGTTTISASLPKGSLSGNMNASFDAAQGRLRSGSTVDATLECCTGPDDYGWGKFLVLVYSALEISDQLTVDHDGFGFMRIMIRTTGNMVQNGEINSPPTGYADVSMTNKVRVDASVAGGDSMSFEDQVKSDFVGLDGTFQVNETRSTHNFMELIVPWEDDLPVDFSFKYDDFMQYEVDGVDAESVVLHGENNFGHTLELFANVYDDQGRLLQGVRVGSSSGIGYLNLDLDPGPDGSVPEPSSLALAAFGALAWLARRRRSS